MAAGYLEDVVGLLAVLAVRKVVDEPVIFVNHVTESLRLHLVDRIGGLLIARLQYNHLQIFLILGIGILLSAFCATMTALA